MAAHVSFTNVVNSDGEEFWKFMAHEDGVNDVRFWTIPRKFAEPFRDALATALSTNDKADRAAANQLST